MIVAKARCDLFRTDSASAAATARSGKVMAVVAVKVFNAEEKEESTAHSALSEATLTATTAMTLPDLAVAAAEAESVQKISRRAFATVTPCGRQTDHSLKVFSLSRDFIENRGRGHRAASSQWCAMAKKGTSSNPAARHRAGRTGLRSRVKL